MTRPVFRGTFVAASRLWMRNTAKGNVIPTFSTRDGQHTSAVKDVVDARVNSGLKNNVRVFRYLILKRGCHRFYIIKHPSPSLEIQVFPLVQIQMTLTLPKVVYSTRRALCKKSDICSIGILGRAMSSPLRDALCSAVTAYQSICTCTCPSPISNKWERHH